jgi:hypothetical protein
VVPLTVQTLVVVEAKDTVRPELAVAESVNGLPTVCTPGLLKVIVCGVRLAAFTVSVAALLVTLPVLLLTVTVKLAPLSPITVAAVVYELDVAPPIAVAFFFH